MNRSNFIAGRLRVVLRRPGGPPLMQRRAHNTVMRSGAELIAALFRGDANTPINGMAVGIDNTPASPPYEMIGLTTTHPDGSPAVQQAAVILPPDVMRVEVLPEEFKVRVSIRSIIPESAAVSPDPDDPRVMIGEAALGVLAADGQRLERIYNRVVFEPVPKTSEHEMALYWEIDFPYGP